MRGIIVDWDGLVDLEDCRTKGDGLCFGYDDAEPARTSWSSCVEAGPEASTKLFAKLTCKILTGADKL